MSLKEIDRNSVKSFHRITKETFRFKYISNDEVQKKLKNMKRNKYPGIENLPPDLLLDCAEVISQHLSHLINNHSLSQGIFPNDWKTAKVVPIQKGDKRKISGNYRPFSLLSILSKIMEKVIYRQFIT